METRGIKRIEIELKGKIFIPEETKKKIGILKEVTFKTENISLNGALVLTTHYLPKGINVTLSFYKDKKKGVRDFEISADVAYCKFISIRKYKIGVKFTGLGKHEEGYIKNLLSLVA